MSARPPWVKPAISFGIPLLAVVVALPYITGHGYGFPSLSDAAQSVQDARRTVGHAISGEGGPNAAAPGERARIYECRTATGRVLSSTPCGRDARVHDIDPTAVNHFQPPPAPPAPAIQPGTAQPHDGSPAGILAGVRSDLAAAQSVDEKRRAAAEADTE